MNWRSGKHTDLERRVAICLYRNGFDVKEIAEVLNRSNPYSVKQNIARWEKEENGRIEGIVSRDSNS